MDEIYTGLMRLRGPVAKTEIVGFCRLDAFGACGFEGLICIFQCTFLGQENIIPV